MVEQQQQQQQPREAGTKSKYDAHFTDRVIAATGLKANPRLAQIMPSLVKHLHDFAREVDLTVEEWMAGVEMVSFFFLLYFSLTRGDKSFIWVYII